MTLNTAIGVSTYCVLPHSHESHSIHLSQTSCSFQIRVLGKDCASYSSFQFFLLRIAKGSLKYFETSQPYEKRRGRSTVSYATAHDVNQLHHEFLRDQTLAIDQSVRTRTKDPEVYQQRTLCKNLKLSGNCSF